MKKPRPQDIAEHAQRERERERASWHPMDRAVIESIEHGEIKKCFPEKTAIGASETRFWIFMDYTLQPLIVLVVLGLFLVAAYGG